MTEENERRATEDLLAGFDRPGRSPRAPAVRLDFHAHAPAASHETVLVTRRRARLLWPWLVGAFCLSAVVGVVALRFVLAPPADEVRPTVASPDAGVHTPATPASAAPPTPPAPSVSVAESATPPVSAPPKQGAAPKAPKPAPAPKPEHRGDFIQDL